MEDKLSRMAVRVETVQGAGLQSQSTRSMRHGTVCCYDVHFDAHCSRPAQALRCIEFRNYYSAWINIKQRVKEDRQNSSWVKLLSRRQLMANAHFEDDAQNWHRIWVSELDPAHFSPRGAALGKGSVGGVLRIEVAQPSPTWVRAELHDIRCWGGTSAAGLVSLDTPLQGRTTAAGNTSGIRPTVSPSPTGVSVRRGEPGDGGDYGADTTVAAMRAWPTPRREPNPSTDSVGSQHAPRGAGPGIQSSMLAMCGLAGIRCLDKRKQVVCDEDLLEHEIEAARRQAAWARQRTAPPVRSPFDSSISNKICEESELQIWCEHLHLDDVSRGVPAGGSGASARIQRELQALFDSLSQQLMQFRSSTG